MVAARTPLAVRVTPKASRKRIECDDSGVLKVYVTAAPEDGKANKAVIEMLAKYLGVAKGRLRIVAGEASRDKVVELL